MKQVVINGKKIKVTKKEIANNIELFENEKFVFVGIKEGKLQISIEPFEIGIEDQIKIKSKKQSRKQNIEYIYQYVVEYIHLLEKNRKADYSVLKEEIGGETFIAMSKEDLTLNETAIIDWQGKGIYIYDSVCDSVLFCKNILEDKIQLFKDYQYFFQIDEQFFVSFEEWQRKQVKREGYKNIFIWKDFIIFSDKEEVTMNKIVIDEKSNFKNLNRKEVITIIKKVKDNYELIILD